MNQRLIIAGTVLLAISPAQAQTSCVSWVQVQPAGGNGPRPAGNAALWYDPIRQAIRLYQPAQGYVFDWNGTQWVSSTTIDPLPSNLAANHIAVAWDWTRGTAISFGGVLPVSPYPGITYDMGRAPGSVLSTTGPSDLYLHRLVSDPIRGRVLLFGGVQASSGIITANSWEWNGLTWIYRGGLGGGLAGAAVAHDGELQRYWIIGGIRPNGQIDESVFTAAPSDNGWATYGVASPAGVGNRFGASAVWDASRNRLVLFGGERGTQYLGDTWEHNSATGWTLRLPTGPTPRSFASMAYDPQRQVVVLFGGYTPNGPLNDTWELRVTNPPIITSPPTSRSVIYRNPVSFSVAAQSESPLTYQWVRNGIAIPQANSPTYSIPAAAPLDAGTYSVVISDGCVSVSASAMLHVQYCEADIATSGTGAPGPDGFLTGEDFDLFIIKFFTGCAQ